MNRQKIAILGISLLLICGCFFIVKKLQLNYIISKHKTATFVRAMNSPSSSDQIDQRLLNANNEFAFKLFTQTVQEDENKNVFISPFSVSMALSLLYNGADGETQRQMAEVLELQDLKLIDVNQSYQRLQTFLENKSEVELSIANSIWLRKGFPIESEFLNNNQEYYQAEVTELDFDNFNARTIINNWVKLQTKGKIEEIIDSVEAQSVLFLINAIYFKGTWTNEFDPNLTQAQPFYLNNGEQINHLFMSQKEEKMYYENDDFQAVNLPYGKDKSLSMYIFLPKEKSNLNIFLEKLNRDNWQKWLKEFRQIELLLAIPKFKLDYEIELNKTLQYLGMTDIFNAKANFKNMTPARVIVDKVKHKTFVEVNEEGTEAAAVTSIGIRATSISKTVNMIVNRPFFYAIQDQKTGTILFMGQMLE